MAYFWEELDPSKWGCTLSWGMPKVANGRWVCLNSQLYPWLKCLCEKHSSGVRLRTFYSQVSLLIIRLQSGSSLLAVSGPKNFGLLIVQWHHFTRKSEINTPHFACSLVIRGLFCEMGYLLSFPGFYFLGEFSNLFYKIEGTISSTTCYVFTRQWLWLLYFVLNSVLSFSIRCSLVMSVG